MQHFRSNTALARAYDDRVERDPVGAVLMVLATPLAIDVGDVVTPYLATHASIPTQHDRSAYAIENGPAIAREKRAISLARNAEQVRAQRAQHVTNTTTTARAAFVESRVLELEAEHHAKLRAAWRATAEAEAKAKFDAPPPVTEPEPVRARRRSA